MYWLDKQNFEKILDVDEQSERKSKMENILKTIIENLVDDKEAISIEKKEDGNKVTFEVKVGQNEMGKVIGRQGKIAHSIRTLMKSVGAKEQKKVDIEFLD